MAQSGDVVSPRTRPPGRRQRRRAGVPDFFLVGAMKCGTTALWRYLEQHPQTAMSRVKEPAYFYYAGGAPRFHGPRAAAEPGYRYEPPPDGSLESADIGELPPWATDWNEYVELFRGRDGAVTGESSTIYLYDPRVPQQLAGVAGGAKILMILRHPLERAFSQYLHMLRMGREKVTDFTRAVALEPHRIERRWGPDWHYCARSQYRRQVERYLAAFPPGAVKVCFYDDLRADPAGMVREIFAFLGVDPDFRPDVSRRYNDSIQAWVSCGRQRTGLIHRAKRRLLGRPEPGGRGGRPPRGMAIPRLEPDVRERLAARFDDDITWLERLTGRDLAAWRR